MPKKCINRKCVLLNCAYNLTLNNVLNGIGSVMKALLPLQLGGFIMMAFGVLLLVGTYKENRSLILTFLIFEPFLLAFELVKLGATFQRGVAIFDILTMVGVIVCTILLYPVYLLFKDLEKNNLNKEAAENSDNNETVKNVAV